MNIQIRVQVPKPEGSRSYVGDTDVQVITDPTTVRAVLTAIIACEREVPLVDCIPETELHDEGFTSTPEKWSSRD
jgi:hypothetical protein